jgi:hypothetical protein
MFFYIDIAFSYIVNWTIATTIERWSKVGGGLIRKNRKFFFFGFSLSTNQTNGTTTVEVYARFLVASLTHFYRMCGFKIVNARIRTSYKRRKAPTGAGSLHPVQFPQHHTLYTLLNQYMRGETESGHMFSCLNIVSNHNYIIIIKSAALQTDMLSHIHSKTNEPE